MTLHSSHFDCCSSHCSEIEAMKCSTTCHDDVHSAELATNLTLGYWEYSAVFPVNFHSRVASKSDDLPSTRTLNAPRNRIRREFYYHINKIYRQHRICKQKNWIEIKLRKKLLKVSDCKKNCICFLHGGKVFVIWQIFGNFRVLVLSRVLVF
jgi:hypothetical protein